jgi:hypothetical protein
MRKDSQDTFLLLLAAVLFVSPSFNSKTKQTVFFFPPKPTHITVLTPSCQMLRLLDSWEAPTPSENHLFTSSLECYCSPLPYIQTPDSPLMDSQIYSSYCYGAEYFGPPLEPGPNPNPAFFSLPGRPPSEHPPRQPHGQHLNQLPKQQLEVTPVLHPFTTPTELLHPYVPQTLVPYYPAEDEPELVKEAGEVLVLPLDPFEASLPLQLYFEEALIESHNVHLPDPKLFFHQTVKEQHGIYQKQFTKIMSKCTTFFLSFSFHNFFCSHASSPVVDICESNFSKFISPKSSFSRQKETKTRNVRALELFHCLVVRSLAEKFLELREMGLLRIFWNKSHPMFEWHTLVH